MTSTVPGSELTKEPFRWDQRIFGLVINLPGSYPMENQGPTYIPLAENCPLDAMCEVTGGKCPDILGILKYTFIDLELQFLTDMMILVWMVMCEYLSP